MPPGKDTKSVPFDDTPENASQEDSQQTLNVQQLLDMQKDAVTTRRRKVEDELRKSHKQGFGRLQRRHDEDMAEYEEQLESAQRPFLEKLAELVKRKKLLESEIEKLLGDLQQPNTCMTEQFDACFKSRVNALRE